MLIIIIFIYYQDIINPVMIIHIINFPKQKA